MPSRRRRAYETGLKRHGLIPDALRESMRAVEKIDPIRILDAGGMVGGAGSISANRGDSLSGRLMRDQYSSPNLGAILDEAGFGMGKDCLDTVVRGLGSGAAPPAADERVRTDTWPTGDTPGRKTEDDG